MYVAYDRESRSEMGRRDLLCGVQGGVDETEFERVFGEAHEELLEVFWEGLQLGV